MPHQNSLNNKGFIVTLKQRVTGTKTGQLSSLSPFSAERLLMAALSFSWGSRRDGVQQGREALFLLHFVLSRLDTLWTIPSPWRVSFSSDETESWWSKAVLMQSLRVRVEIGDFLPRTRGRQKTQSKPRLCWCSGDLGTRGVAAGWAPNSSQHAKYWNIPLSHHF